jgi:hypothetical protein
MNRRRSAIPATLIVALAASGCGVEADPVEPPPRSAEPAAAPTTGGSVGKYDRLAATCPALDGRTARRLKLPAAGKPADVNADTPVSQIVTCTWGDGAGSVSVLVTIDRRTGAPTAEESIADQFEEDWRAAVGEGRTLASEPISGLGDQAYLGVHRDRRSIVLSVRASNAQIQVSYGVADIPPEALTASVDKCRDTLVSLGRDVLDDLK